MCIDPIRDYWMGQTLWSSEQALIRWIFFASTSRLSLTLLADQLIGSFLINKSVADYRVTLSLGQWCCRLKSSQVYSCLSQQRFKLAILWASKKETNSVEPFVSIEQGSIFDECIFTEINSFTWIATYWSAIN